MAESAQMTPCIPRAVAKLFLPQERPTFELIREVGRCRLWRSQTIKHELHGRPRPAREAFHVTVGEEVDLAMMRSAAAALANFEATVRECGG